MSRKPGSVPEETRAKLIASATEEFHRCGFESASLRRICANAGVTTGAMYFFFKNKDELFEAVISPAMERVIAVISDHFRKEQETIAYNPMLDDSEDIHAGELILTTYFANKDLFEIILCNREHPLVVGFFDRMTAMCDAQTIAIATGNGVAVGENSRFNEATVHWFSHLEIDTIIHVITHNSSEEKAKKQLAVMMRFMEGGFLALIQE